jgi:hypothetical protein
MPRINDMRNQCEEKSEHSQNCEWLDGNVILRFNAPYDNEALLHCGWATYTDYSFAPKYGQSIK